MKIFKLLFACAFLSAPLQAQTTEAECTKTKRLITEALEVSNTETNVLDSLEVFTDCFDVVYDVYNDYDGASDRDPYQDFLDALADSGIKPKVQKTVIQQHLAAVEDSMGKEGLEFVNSISFIAIRFNGQLLHVIESGWGDDDFYYYHVFKSTGKRSLIQFAW